MENELERFEKDFLAVMSSGVLPMDGMMRYVSMVPGKRLRPRLVFLSAKLFGEVNDVTRRTALFVEMFHTATLIHDDVVDGSDIRRGQASLNAYANSKLAVLAGDYLLAKALAQLSHPEDYQILQEMLQVAMVMSEGEVMQSGELRVKSEELRVKSEELYLEITKRKTARLIQACCVCGAMSVTSNLSILTSQLTRFTSLRAAPFSPLTSHLISDFGLNLGLVFQMRDDILDNDDPETTALAQRLLPDYLDKALKNLDALTPYIIDKDALDSLRELTLFCAERNH